MLKDTEIMRRYIEEIRKGITENCEQQNNQNEETCENRGNKLRKWRKRLLVMWWDMKQGR